MFSIVFLLLLSLPTILLLYFRKRTTHTTLNDGHLSRLPGPPGLPFIGNLHQFDGEFPHKYLHALSNQYGPILSLTLGSRQVVVISSSDLVREVMKSDLAFSGRPRLTSLQRLSYNGLDIAFSPYNDSWREMRRVAALHLFGAKNLPSFRPICRDEVSSMMGKMARDASLSRATNLSETMISFASNTICRVAFGRSYGGEGGYGGKNRFYDVLHETQAVMGGFYVRDYFPVFGWMDKLSGMNARLEKNFRELDAFYEELIEEHLRPDRPKSMDGDIIDLLLGLKRDGSSSSFHLTMDHIKALLMNIITGGTDTVSATLVWALTALMKKPQIMEKAQREIRQLGEKKDIIDEDTAKLPYLKAVIKETLRLHLPAPLLVPRETTQKCTIGGYEIERGTMVYLNAWAIGRDPKTWENADEFLPERFLERDDVDVRGRDAEVIPFGVGRRGCPGIAIGMSEVEVVLANVLYRFNWRLPDGVEGVDFDVVPGMTTHKKNALCLVPELVIA